MVRAITTPPHIAYSTEDVIAGKFTLTKEQWVGVLRIARPWRMEKVRHHALKVTHFCEFTIILLL
jgi:hypothetical protein